MSLFQLIKFVFLLFFTVFSFSCQVFFHYSIYVACVICTRFSIESRNRCDRCMIGKQNLRNAFGAMKRLAVEGLDAFVGIRIETFT